MSTERIIVALDLDDLQTATRIVDLLSTTTFFKVGLQAFLRFGNELLTLLISRQRKIFLDLKFFDIPNTVYNAIKASSRFHPKFLTIHLSGGAKMIERAVQAAQEIQTTILGVTVLTSFNEEELQTTGVSTSVQSQVLRLTELGLKNGVKHFVCSPQEIELLKANFGLDITLITPGVRPAWSEKNDQQRTLSPAEALARGADYLVIGRPLVAHPRPEEAWQKLIQEIS